MPWPGAPGREGCSRSRLLVLEEEILRAARGRTPHRIVEWRQDLEQTRQGETAEAAEIGLFRADRGRALGLGHPRPVEGEQRVADVLAEFAQVSGRQEEAAEARKIAERPAEHRLMDI